MDENEDDVVATLPIFINEKFSDFQQVSAPVSQLLLLTFPTSGLALLPLQGKVKTNRISLEMNTTGMPKEQNSSMDLDDEDIPKAIHMDSFKVPSNARYMAGVVRDGQLHLSPLDIYQLRPSLSYIDQKMEKDKETRIKNSWEDHKELNPNYEEEARSIQVTFRSAEDKEGFRRASHAKLEHNSNMENWKSLEIHHPHSSTSKRYLKHLYASRLLEANLDEPSSHYLSTISTSAVPEPQMLPRAKKFDANMSFYESRGLVLHDRLMILLVSAHVISYTTLLDLFARENERDAKEGVERDPVESGDLLAVLPQLAYCVRGLWVVKSNLLYQDRIRDARDVLLGTLLQHGVASRSAWSLETEMNAEMGGNMLKEICVYDPSRGWVFKLPDDESFGELHPDVQEKQHELLGNLAEKALLTFAALAAKTGSNSSTSSVGLPVPAAKTHSAKKLQAISSSLLELYELEGATSQDQSQNLIKQMLKKHGVLHRPHMHQIFHHQAKQGGDDNMLGQVSQSSIDSIISNLGFEIRPDVFALTSVGNSTLDPLRKVTMRMYTTKDVIKKADMIEAWVEATSSRPSDVIYKKVMAEFGLPRPGGHWRLKGLADA